VSAYLTQLRASLGDAAADRSDEELLDAVAKARGVPTWRVADQYGYDPGTGGMNRERLSASIDSYQSNLYDVAGHAARGLGLDSAAGWLDRQRQRNQVQADVAAGRAQALGGVDSYKDVDWTSPSSIGNYGAGLAIQSLPYLGEAAVGGGVGSFALRGAGLAARGSRMAATAGAVAAGYPSAVGDILSNQRDQTGETDGAMAAIGGVPSTALNAVGLEGALARRTGFRNAVNLLDQPGGVRGAALRAGTTALGVGTQEGASEVGQEFANQYFGRMAVDPSEQFLSPDAVDRYKESFVGGGLLGAAGGGAAGGWRRSAGWQASAPPLAEQPAADLLQPPAPQPLQQVETRVPSGLPSELDAWRAYQQDQDQQAAFDQMRGALSPLERDPAALARLAATEQAGLSPQFGLFDYYQPRPADAPQVADDEAPPAASSPGPDLFSRVPTATVRTNFGGDSILRELRMANGGVTDGYVARLAAGLDRFIDDPAHAKQFLADEQSSLEGAALKTETVEKRRRVLDAAAALAARFNARQADAQVQESYARPQDSEPAQPTPAQRERRSILDQVLADTATQRPRQRFTAALRKAKIPVLEISPDEAARIQEFEAGRRAAPVAPPPQKGLTGENQQKGQDGQGRQALLTPQEPAATAAPAPDEFSPHVGVAVEIDAGGKKERVADAGAALRAAKQTEQKYHAFLRCLGVH
jgi:hypothetical protein